jgi:hypothetical protein
VLISCEVNKEEEGGVLKYLLVLGRGADRMAPPEGRRGMETERSATGEGHQSSILGAPAATSYQNELV